jgi:6-phosphofructokinase 2
MIRTITLNPAIDKGFKIDRLAPDHKLRCPNPTVEAGGGGINVARCLHRLGAVSQAVFLSGGVGGRLIESLLTAEAIDFIPVSIAGETRESIMINETSTGNQYRIVTEGPLLDEVMASTLPDILLSGVKPSDIVVISGSLPNGLLPDFPAMLSEKISALGGRCIIDAGGQVLKTAIEKGVYLVKPNLQELAALSGVENLELDAVDDAARQLINEGRCQFVVVSLGPAGALWVSRDGEGHVAAPTVKRLSTVGAGDSMVAGIVFALDKGWDIQEAVRWGVACGSATTMQPGTRLFDRADVNRLYDWIRSKKN